MSPPLIDLLLTPLKLLHNRPPRSPRKPQLPDADAPAVQLDLFYADDPAGRNAGAARPVDAAPDSSIHPVARADEPPRVATPPSVITPTQHPSLLPPQPPGGPRTPAVPGQRRLMLGQQQLGYALRRSKRRTIGFLIDDDGLRITAPRWVTIGEIENAIREKQRWILAKLHEHHERVTRRVQPAMQWRDGARLPYLGNELTLQLVTAGSVGIDHDAALGTLTVCLPADAGEQQLKDRVQAWMQQEAKALFAARLPLYAARLDVSYRAFALSSATTQWGSCTADGKIRLNWRLMHFALPLIDYVIAHELAHLREMNHGPRFWATVQSVFPEFVAAKKALRDHAPETLPAF